jgi:hypothetical protein
LKEADSTIGNSGDHRSYQDGVEQNDHPAPEVLQNESDYAETDNSASRKLTSHKSLPLQNGNTVFSRRSLNIAPENNKLTILDMSSECTNYKSPVPRNLVPLSDTEPHEGKNEKVHHSSVHLSKMCDLFSQTEPNGNIRKSEDVSYLANRKDTFFSETRSERVHVKTKLSDIDSSKHTISKRRVSRHISQRDEYEYKSYSKCKAERYIHSESNRSRTHSRHASSEHHSHPERRESCTTPVALCEGSASYAFRDSRFISHSKAYQDLNGTLKR